MDDGFSLSARVSCRTGRLRGERPLRGVCTLLWQDEWLGASRCSACQFLWHFGGELFDFDKQRPVIVDADAVR
jgi:hypothetical protein